jgi:anti-sigma B factor antagonist
MQTLSIEGELTIYTAAQHKDALVAFLNSGDDLELNLSQVSEMDTAGLQILIMAKKEAAVAGKSLRYSMHSAPVLEILELSRMASVFGDQLVFTGHGD